MILENGIVSDTIAMLPSLLKMVKKLRVFALLKDNSKYQIIEEYKHTEYKRMGHGVFRRRSGPKYIFKQKLKRNSVEILRRCVYHFLLLVFMSVWCQQSEVVVVVVGKRFCQKTH